MAIIKLPTNTEFADAVRAQSPLFMEFVTENWGKEWFRHTFHARIARITENALSTINVEIAILESYQDTWEQYRVRADNAGVAYNSKTTKASLIRLTAMKEATWKTFESLRSNLRFEVKRAKIARMIYDRESPIQSEKAGGVMVITTNAELIQRLLERKAQALPTEARRIRAELRRLGYFISKQ